MLKHSFRANHDLGKARGQEESEGQRSGEREEGREVRGTEVRGREVRGRERGLGWRLRERERGKER